MSRKSHNHGKTRKDRRFKDEDAAPEVVSEKRLTFFLAHVDFSRMKKLGARNTITNVDEGHEDDDALPETPSAIARVAIKRYLDELGID